MDSHVAHYVSDQLERLRTHQESDEFDNGEFETSVDGTSEKRTNGHRNGGDSYFAGGASRKH